MTSTNKINKLGNEYSGTGVVKRDPKNPKRAILEFGPFPMGFHADALARHSEFDHHKAFVQDVEVKRGRIVRVVVARVK